MPKMTGQKLNRELSLGAAHALYHKDGDWYDQLKRFPGVLFDRRGYVLFPDKDTYERCPELIHPEHSRADGRPGTLRVPKGISNIREPRYVYDERVPAFHIKLGIDPEA
jgi:hypothetical protein